MHSTFVDYNTCVDKIIQISPCYDLSGRTDKGKIKEFGYMQSGSKDYGPYQNLLLQNDAKIEMEQIDILGDDYKFDGGDI